MRYSDPYAVQGSWYKGNLHTHTTLSDGRLTPEEAIRWYEQNGYDFVALTDHEVYTDVTPLQQQTRLSLIPAFECGRGVDPQAHMLCLGVRQTYHGSYQDVLTATRALGGFAVFCHPNWIREDLWHPAAMEALRYAAGLEIYNHVITRLPGRALATDDWDDVLSSGHLLWGYANQDAHHPEDFGHAWNMVLARACTVESLVHGLANGHCYATTGLLFARLGYHDGVIDVAVERSASVRFVGPGGVILSEQKAQEATYQPAGEAYVRVEAQSEDGLQAWTQPYWRLTD